MKKTNSRISIDKLFMLQTVIYFFNIVQYSTLIIRLTISQIFMTNKNNIETAETCPAQSLLKMLSGKWKPEIFKLAVNGPIRFSSLLKVLPESNKQSLSTALRELEEVGLFDRVVIKEKPLHVEYNLTEMGKSMIAVFELLDKLDN